MNGLILYSTLSGTTEEVAFFIKKLLEDDRHTITLQNISNNDSKPTLNTYDLILLGAPTYDEGLEIDMKVFLSNYNPDLAGHTVAIFGLGDRFYEEFCTSVKEIEKWVDLHAGSLIVPSIEIESYPLNFEPISHWCHQLREKMRK